MSPGPVAQFRDVEGSAHNNIAGAPVYVQIQDSNNGDTEMADLTAGNPNELYEEAPLVMTVHDMIEQVDANDKSVQFNPFTNQVSKANTKSIQYLWQSTDSSKKTFPGLRYGGKFMQPRKNLYGGKPK